MDRTVVYDLSATEARSIAREVGTVVSQWHREAARLGIVPSEIDRMASAFEHDDLKQSLALSGGF
jgi:serine/threonine-protein kinase HipA